MSNSKKMDTQDLGLQLASIFGKYFLKTEHLHYGFWTSDLEVKLENLPKAQSQYTQLLKAQLPEQVKYILDVGCGTGHNAEILLEANYHVDCVSPSDSLSEKTHQKLQGRGKLYECRFEELPIEHTYDCILFSESLQYINLQQAFAQIDKLLNPGGIVIITDFFRIPAEGTSPMGGGHRLSRFREALANSRFSLEKEQDISTETAPNLQLVDEALTQVAIPCRDLILRELNTHYRWLFFPIKGFAKLFFRKKLDKIQYKYFSGERNAENFLKFKRYYLFVLKKNESIQPL